MKTISQVVLASLLLFIGACKKKETTTEPITNVTINTSLPSVSTLTIIASDDLSAIVKASVSSEGTSALSTVGVCWDTLPAPTTLRMHSNEGAGTGTYQSLLYGLKAGTTYYVRAFATNATGTAYGEELNFKTGTAWEQLTLNTNFNVTSLLYANSTLFAGTGNSGIVASTDEGATWNNVGLLNQSINALAQGGSNLYAGTYNSGFYRSTNGGATWTAANTGLSDPSVRFISASGSTVFVCGNYNISVSLNGGATWTSASNGLPSTYVSSIAYDGSHVFVGTSGSGLYMSSNNGSTWSSINAGLGNNSTSYVYGMCISGNNLIVSFSNGDLYRSSNNGSTWTKIIQASSNTLLTFATRGNSIYAGGYGTSYFSDNNGQTFKEVKAGLNNQMLNASAVSDQNVFMAGSYIFRRPLQ